MEDDEEEDVSCSIGPIEIITGFMVLAVCIAGVCYLYCPAY